MKTSVVSKLTFLKKIYETKTIYNYKNSKKKLSNLEKKNARHLDENDYLISKKLFDPKILKKIKIKLEKNLNFKNTYPPKNMSNYSYQDSLKKLSYEQIVNFPKISKSDHYAGEHVWKQKTSYVVMKSVFNLVDEIKILLRNRNLNKILENYFSNQKYKLTYVKAIKSYANNIPAIDTQFFHSDLDSFKLLKVLIYLDNVTNINQGPSQFVLNSNVFDFMNKKLINNWPIRASEKEIKKNFGNKIKTFLGKCGDALFLNTAMLHRGLKPIQEDRWILILSYCVHDEIFSKGKL